MEQNNPVPVGRTRRNPARRRPWRSMVVLVVLALLIGRGLGWLGSGGEPLGVDRQTPPSAGPPVAAAAMTSAAATPAGAPGQGQPMPIVDEGAVAAPAGGPAAVPLAETASPAARQEASVDPDRFGSLLSVLQARNSEQNFGLAMLVLQHLRGLPLDGPQQAALMLPAGELERGLAAACSALVQSLGAGNVLAADAAALRLLADDQGLVLPVLAESLRICGVSGELQGVPAQDQAPWPLPLPLPRHRGVRARIAGETIVGRVVESRADTVTLRVQVGSGVTFPTVPVVACEPIDGSAPEAVEMGFAALHAGNGLLARLWLGCAALRGGGAPMSERQQRLARLLQ